jgi:hypothetical protein
MSNKSVTSRGNHGGDVDVVRVAGLKPPLTGRKRAAMSTTSLTPIFDEVVQLLGLQLDLDGLAEPVAEGPADVDTADVDTAA